MKRWRKIPFGSSPSFTHAACSGIAALRKIVRQPPERSNYGTQMFTIMGCGVIGALAYTFQIRSGSVLWKIEVYALSSLCSHPFILNVLKWGAECRQPRSISGSCLSFS